MDGESGIIETNCDVKEDDNQAEQNDWKSSEIQSEGFPFFLCHI